MFERRQAQRSRKHVVVKAGGKRSGARKKPAWDSTLSDLTVHQLSKEELELRHSRILSKNADKAKQELEEDGRQQNSMGSHRSSGGGRPTSGSRIQEKALQSVLEDSDRAIAFVKDLFGDDPKRYSARPNVTIAPHVNSNRALLQRTLLESQQDGLIPSALYSPGGIKDESILGLAPVKPALNELPSPCSEFTIDESSMEASSLQLSPPTSYQPVVVNLPRFQRLVEGEGVKRSNGEVIDVSSIAHSGSQQRDGEATIPSNMSSTESDVAGQHHHPLHIVHKMPVKSGASKQQQINHPTTIITTSPITTTAHVSTTNQINSDYISRNERHRKLTPGRLHNNKSVSSTSSGIHDDLSVLQKLVENLEIELQDYEQTSGYCFPTQKLETAKNGTFSSLTASLLASVTKLTHYLKQSEIQLKGEVAVRNQLLHAMAEQQNLMDALTADVVKLQEENGSLKNGLHQLEQHTTQQAKGLEESILELRTKMSSMESSHNKILRHNEPTSLPTSQKSCSDQLPPVTITSSPPHQPTVPSQLMTSHSTTPTALRTDDMLHATTLAPTQPAPLPTTLTIPQTIHTPKPSLYLPHGVTPTPLAVSTSSTLPNMYYTPYPWSVLGTQQQVTHESTPALPTICPHFSPVPAPHFTTPLSMPPVRGGLSLTPSDIGISPPPISVALQVPSLPFRPLIPSPPTHIIPPKPQNSLPSHYPLYSNTISGDRPPLPSLLPQPPSIPLSVPYSWEAPSNHPPVVITANRNSTPSVQTSTSTLLSHSAFTTPISTTTLAVTHSEQGSTVKTAVPLPDLSLTTMSIPVTDTSTPRDVVSPSQSESSLDIEASLARMSSLARSVLQELAEDRGQLLKVSQPPSYSHTPNSKPFRPNTIPRSGTMTTVTSLDSNCSELTLTTTSIDSISTTPGSSPTQERKDQP